MKKEDFYKPLMESSDSEQMNERYKEEFEHNHPYYMKAEADDACMTDEEWEEIKSKPRTLILYPVN